MADSLITGLTPLTDAQVNDSTRELPLADSGSGIAGSATIAQIKLVAGTQKVKYVTAGTEATTLTIADVAGKSIIAVYREGSVLYEVTTPTVPDSQEFTFDTTNITLGLTVNPAGGERFLILFRNI